MTSAAEAPVQTEMRDGVGIVALNRPDKFNCLSSVVMAGLDEALAMFEGDRKVRAVLLLARGKNFCTGAPEHHSKCKRTQNNAAAPIDRPPN